MDITIVGGDFSNENPKKSSIINKIYDAFEYRDLRNISIDNVFMFNGGNMNDDFISAFNIAGKSDLTIWMPNISNETEKHYPAKNIGGILICSKVMREGYKRIDAISRIFKMHGNAVIAIYKDSGLFRFELIDALGNIWYSGSEIIKLCWAIEDFVIFTQSAKRIRSVHRNDDFSYDVNAYLPEIQGLIDCNKLLQEHIMTSCGNRFFGNISTRCTKLFPSLKCNEELMFVSPRNVDKSSITPDIMVPYFSDDSYVGNKKPSVDSPTQIRIYQNLPNINFMIHGHANIDVNGAVTTDEYRLCGDINEVDEVLHVIDKNTGSFIVNLKNHGFLIGAKDIETLNNTVIYIINNAKIKITNQED